MIIRPLASPHLNSGYSSASLQTSYRCELCRSCRALYAELRDPEMNATKKRQFPLEAAKDSLPARRLADEADSAPDLFI